MIVINCLRMERKLGMGATIVFESSSCVPHKLFILFVRPLNILSTGIYREIRGYQIHGLHSLYHNV